MDSNDINVTRALMIVVLFVRVIYLLKIPSIAYCLACYIFMLLLFHFVAALFVNGVSTLVRVCQCLLAMKLMFTR